MCQVKFLGPIVLCVIDGNFDVVELKKSISKKTEDEIVLSRTGAMLSMAEIDLDRPTAAGRRRQSIDRQSGWMGLRALSKMRHR